MGCPRQDLLYGFCIIFKEAAQQSGIFWTKQLFPGPCHRGILIIIQEKGVMQEHHSRLEETAKTALPLHQVAHLYVMQIRILVTHHCVIAMQVSLQNFQRH